MDNAMVVRGLVWSDAPRGVQSVYRAAGAVANAEALNGGAGSLPSFEPVVPELVSPSGSPDTDQLATLLLEIREKSISAQQKAVETSLKADKVERDLKNKELIAKLLENLDKMQKANAAGIFGKIFGYIAAAFALVAGVATANPALIAGAVVAVSLLVVQETNALKNLDSKAAMAVTITLTALSALLSLGGGVAASGSAVAQTAVQSTAQGVKVGANIATGVASVAGGGANCAKAVFAKEAVDSQADSVEIRGHLAKLKASMDDNAEYLADLVQDLQSYFDIVSQVHQSSAEAKSRLCRFIA